MKKIVSLVMLAVVLLGSCRKEIQPNGVDVSKLTNTDPVNTTPIISNAAINNWFVKNPMGQYLSVDWKKARQTTINGVAVVTVPVKNILPARQSDAKQVSGFGGSSSTTPTLTTFDPYHPPALYFFQDKNSATPDSVKGILMNFVPDDPTKEDGANKVWTGKLAEWNMESSTAYYQHLVKSKVDAKYSFDLSQASPGTNSSTTKVNSTSTKQTAALKTNSIFSDIWEGITDFFNYIGWVLGIPGSENNYSYPNTIIGDNWCFFLWGIFCGGDGGGGSSGDNGGGATYYYSVVYNNYVPGYNGDNVASGAGWTFYGGGTGGPNDPCGGGGATSVKGKEIQVAAPGCGVNVVITSAQVVNSVAVKYNLSTTQQVWLNNNLGYFNALTDYLGANPDASVQDNADFLNSSINYLMDNPDVSVYKFQNQLKLEDDLKNELDVNPYLLIRCDVAQKFKDLESYTPPTAAVNRLNNLNVTYPDPFMNQYYVQNIKAATGWAINLDRFEIKVATLPVINGTRDPSAFLEFIRVNLNQFIDNNITTFQPYVDPAHNVDDTNLWLSSNPVSALLHLNIYGPLGTGDNGSVVVDDHSSNHWTVSTIRTPVDGIHPVTGNRQWGYDTNSDGTYTFYVTGADRITRPVTQIAQILFSIPFNRADNLWESYQSGIEAFVNTHDGMAVRNLTPTKLRPDYQSLSDYFNGTLSLAQLKLNHGCQ